MKTCVLQMIYMRIVCAGKSLTIYLYLLLLQMALVLVFKNNHAEFNNFFLNEPI
jgi:hypothetical protein